MQYVRSISGSVSKTWNSINPATLSGAIDVIVVENDDGSLSCSPFHVRFGKWSLLRPYEKKVEFSVNGARQNYAMKLGEGGEAFFVFETTASVPEALQTSPIVSPATSPQAGPTSNTTANSLVAEPEPFDLEPANDKSFALVHPAGPSAEPLDIPGRRDVGEQANPALSQSFPGIPNASDLNEWPGNQAGTQSHPSSFSNLSDSNLAAYTQAQLPRAQTFDRPASSNSNSPPFIPRHQAVERAMTLSKKLKSSNIASRVTETGDLMLDMTGYKSGEEEALRAEALARQILSEELEGQYDIGSLIGADEDGHIWIYSSEDAKEAAARRIAFSGFGHASVLTSDAASDPGYHSDDEDQSQKGIDVPTVRGRGGSDSAVGLSPPSPSPISSAAALETSKSYAKTLRLTSEQLKALQLKPGPNPISFSVNRATCQANMYLWRHDAPIVVSDVDGTITKSDALGHVLNMIGRDWTHLGVAKLYTDIVANGYHIMYLTSRSVGQADTTRAYLNGIVQDGYKLPKGPVIMSPDRTLAALRREVYLRKPEVFKMACLRDIMGLFGQRRTPFYAGFGNRLTDALSYRSVNVPPTRIFTINTNSEVSVDLLSLNKYRTGYASMREIVDHFFPPVGMAVHEGGEDYTDFNYWRDRPRDLDEISLSDSEADEEESEEGEDDIMSDQGESYMSRESIDGSLAERMSSSLDLRRSVEQARIPSRSTSEKDDTVSYDEDPDALDLIAEAAGGQGLAKRLHSRSQSRPRDSQDR